jgi:hypothetical protein
VFSSYFRFQYGAEQAREGGDHLFQDARPSCYRRRQARTGLHPLLRIRSDRIRNSLYWSDMERLVLGGFGTPCEVGSGTPSDLEFLVLVGSGTHCTGRIWNALHWSDPELLVLVGSGTPCTGWIRNSLYWSDLERFVLVGSNALYWSDPELLVLVLVGSGTSCTGRIRNALYWSDPELLVLVGYGTHCTGRIQKSLCWLVLEKLSRIQNMMGFFTMIAFALP